MAKEDREVKRDPSDEGYEEALENYQERPDIEPLDERRAREVGESVRDGAFVRDGEASGVITTDDTKGKKPAQNKKIADK